MHLNFMLTSFTNLQTLHPTVVSWSFDEWGLDVVRPFTSKSYTGHVYILVSTGYFFKWVEDVALSEVKKENVVHIIRSHSICWYGVPWYIITDYGKKFVNKLLTGLCEKFKFSQHKSSMYNALANRLAKAFNKTMCNLLNKWYQNLSEIGVRT